MIALVGSDVTFRSTSFLFQVGGSIAETLTKPRGGTAVFLEINGNTCVKLQNESGYLGYTNSIFIVFLFALILRKDKK
jgi:spore germination protein GerM